MHDVEAEASRASSPQPLIEKLRAKWLEINAAAQTYSLDPMADRYKSHALDMQRLGALDMWRVVEEFEKSAAAPQTRISLEKLATELQSSLGDSQTLAEEYRGMLKILTTYFADPLEVKKGEQEA